MTELRLIPGGGERKRPNATKPALDTVPAYNADEARAMLRDLGLLPDQREEQTA